MHETIRADIIVIGGGISGCFAAITARDLGMNVLQVDKGTIGRSGLSPMMSGVLTYFDPSADSYEDWFEECVVASQWLSDQDVLDNMILETADCIHKMEHWGVKFQKEEGAFIRKPMVGHSHGRNVMMTNGGLQLMAVLRGEVLRRGIRVLERVMVTDVLTADGEMPTKGPVVGALGFNIRNGKLYRFEAKATVIATGMTGVVLLRSPANVLSGDGRAAAFRAGCEMRNIELSQYSPHPLGLNCAPGLNILAGEGAVLVNARGERFMEKWDPVLMERSTRVRICKAISTEELEGRGPVYFDATRLNESAHNKIEKCIPIVVNTLELVGMSFRKNKIPYTADLINLEAGGIRTDKNKRTTLSGLYAVGDASDHGEMGVTELLTPGISSAIDGVRAAKSIAEYAEQMDIPVTNDEQVETLTTISLAPTKKSSGLSFLEVRNHCKDVFRKGFLGPAKTEGGLRQARGMIDKIRQEQVKKVKADDYHQLAATLGLENALNFLDLYVACSLFRTESRGSHWRRDYPEADDENWLKWVVARREGAGLALVAEPIPFDKYPLKPNCVRATDPARESR